MTLESISIDDNQNSHLIKKVNFLGEENPSLLLIHGWGSNHKIWEDCIVSFSDTFNIFILDLLVMDFVKIIMKNQWRIIFNHYPYGFYLIGFLLLVGLLAELLLVF